MQHITPRSVKGRKRPYAKKAQELEFWIRYKDGFEVMALLQCGSTVQLELESRPSPILLQSNATNKDLKALLSVISSRGETPIEAICRNSFQLLRTNFFPG